jgi:exodeoxyribonuclease V alpha subunit
MIAAIKHVLAASREQGNCFLTEEQINTGIMDLIEMNLGECLLSYLEIMKQDDQLRTRKLVKEGMEYTCYYSKTLFYDEATVAKKLKEMKGDVSSDPERIATWVNRYS